MKSIDAATTRRHLPFDALIDALRAMFVAGCEVRSEEHTSELQSQ